MAENPKLVSLADLNGDNGTEFLEKCVNNWNAWVELTRELLTLRHYHKNP